MKIIYTDHAKQRLKERNINRNDIDRAVKNPTLELLQKGGVSLLQYKTTSGLLEIICKKSHTACVIITCYFL